MPTNAERARELPPGEELDALFFETCWGWSKQSVQGHECVVNVWRTASGDYPNCGDTRVTTDAAACEAWVMRWCRENEFRLMVCDGLNHKNEFVAIASIRRKDGRDEEYFLETAENHSLWHALTRAAIAAAEAMGVNDGN